MHPSICVVAAIAFNNSRLCEMALYPYLAAIDKLSQIRKGSKICSWFFQYSSMTLREFGYTFLISLYTRQAYQLSI